MPRPGGRSAEGRGPAGLEPDLVRLADAFVALGLGAAVGTLALGDFIVGTLVLGNFTVGTLRRGTADRRLRERTGRGMSAVIKADPGTRLVRRRGTGLFRSVGLSVGETGFPATDQRRRGPPMVPGARPMDGPPTSPATRASGARTLATTSREMAAPGPSRDFVAHPKVFPTCEGPGSGYGNDTGPA